MKDKKKVSILIFLLAFNFVIPISSNLIDVAGTSENNTASELPLFSSKFELSELNNWQESIRNADQNNNGINDQLDKKLNSVFGSKIGEPNSIPIIVMFPIGDFSSIIPFFEDLGGIIKVVYKYAINGFAGTIDKLGLKQFTEILWRENVPFIIEEDGKVETKMYYVSRNLNLRPYVWNTLGYTGDPDGSIAIIDTGLDDSHQFFAPGYSNASSTHKIVGWQDFVNGLTDPYDDQGHGSHCGGIAAGEGGPNNDGSGRVVATVGDTIDLTGLWLPEITIDYSVARFNVTEEGIVDVYCEFDDFTISADDVDLTVYLYHEESIVASYANGAPSWSYNLTYNVTSSDLGDYSLWLSIAFDDQNFDSWCDDPYYRFRGEIHWPFNPPQYGCGDHWKGVAPDTQLVGLKVIDSDGQGDVSDVVAAVDWTIANKMIYNITVISMSLGYGAGQTSLINAVNNAVENGIVTAVSAGNDGATASELESPADADKVITVAAMSNADRVTEYSSRGRSSYTGYTVKPDIMAPGGSEYNFSIFSTDTNDNDAAGEYPADKYANETMPSLGTSMAAPAVAGAANLVIQAMGGRLNWNYTGLEAKQVKALLLMTATETYPLTREVDTGSSPALNRGGKDIHEGYGRLNVDAAIEAVTQELTGISKTALLSTSSVNPYNKHALAGYLDLTQGESYFLNLTVPGGADFDLHLYNSSPSAYGEPVLLESGISNGLGSDEGFYFSPTMSGRYYLVAKAISGEGVANISCRLNLQPANLTAGIAFPLVGNLTTFFSFNVSYSDLDNMPPVAVNLLLNGSSIPMIQQDPIDAVYHDGCLFNYSTYLLPGNHNVSFECYDGLFYIYTNVLTDIQVNITQVNLFFPLTEAIFYPGLINFTWSSLDSPLGPINFTLQIGSSPTFSNVVYEVTGIPETPGNTSTLIPINLQPGTYYWRICATYGGVSGAWSGFSQITIQAVPGQPFDWIWIVLIGAIAAVAVVSMLVVSSRRKKSPYKTTETYKPTSETRLLPTSLDKIRIPSMISSVIAEQAKETEIFTPNFQCRLCYTKSQIKKPNYRIKYSCSSCGGLLYRLVDCTNCGSFVQLLQSDYSNIIGTKIRCPTCEMEFVVRDVDAISPQLKVKGAPVTSYLKVDPETFYCDICGKHIYINQSAVRMLNQCPTCRQTLDRVLIGTQCDHTQTIKPEEAFEYIMNPVLCPMCMERTEKPTEISEIVPKPEIGISPVEIPQVAEAPKEIVTTKVDEDVPVEIPAYLDSIEEEGVPPEMPKEPVPKPVEIPSLEATKAIDLLEEEVPTPILLDTPEDTVIRIRTPFKRPEIPKDSAEKVLPELQDVSFKEAPSGLPEISKPLAVKVPTETSAELKASPTMDLDQEVETYEQVKQNIFNLTDPEEIVRYDAVEQLGKLGEELAIPTLIDVLKYDSSNKVRKMAVIALGMIGSVKALPTLRRVVVEDNDPEIRKHAAEAVEYLESYEEL